MYYKWTKKDIEFIKGVLKSNSNKKFNYVMNILKEHINLPYKNIANKITTTKELEELRLENKIFKQGEKEKIKIELGFYITPYENLSKKLVINKDYLFTEYTEETRGNSDNYYKNKRGKIIDYNKRFIIVKYDNYKRCYLWNTYSIDWKIRGVKR